MSQGCFWRFQGRIHFFTLFLLWRPSAFSGLCLFLVSMQSLASLVMSLLLTPILLSPYCKDLCDSIGPTQTIKDDLFISRSLTEGHFQNTSMATCGLMLDWITEGHSPANFTHKIDNHIVPENSELDWAGLGHIFEECKDYFLIQAEMGHRQPATLKASGLLKLALVGGLHGGQATRTSSVCGTMDTVLMIKMMDSCFFSWQPQSRVGKIKQYKHIVYVGN